MSADVLHLILAVGGYRHNYEQTLTKPACDIHLGTSHDKLVGGLTGETTCANSY